MKNQEDKYVSIDVTKFYEYVDMPGEVSDHCDNCDGVKFKGSVGNGKFLRECTNCGIKKNIFKKEVTRYDD